MPATPYAGLRYPIGSDAPNVPQYLQQLATDVDNRFNPDSYSILLANNNAIPGVGLAGYVDSGGWKQWSGSVGTVSPFNGIAGTPLCFIPPPMLPTVIRRFEVPLSGNTGPASAFIDFHPDGWVRIGRDTGPIPGNTYWYFDAVRYLQ